MGEYFDKNVVESAKARGILVNYYDDTLQINGGSVIRVDSREQAEEMRNKEIADIKERGGNIYSFEVVFGPAKGEETSKPKLIYRSNPTTKAPKEPGGASVDSVSQRLCSDLAVHMTEMIH